MQPSRPTPIPVRFSPFEVDLASAELRKRGRKVPLQEQPFKVLALLLHRPGELVTREELQRALWPGDAFGEFDEGLNKAIQKLRQALDDSTDSPKYIETLPRKGYRFIAVVEVPTEQVETTPEPAQEVKGIPAGRSGREVLAWVLVAILTLALLAAVGMRQQQPGEIHAVRFQVSPPDKVIPDPDDIPVVSPDGRYLVFGGADQEAKHHLWVHSLGSLATQMLPETESKDGQVYPFWSPDSRSIGFFQGEKLKKIDVTGGQAVVLCDAPFPVYGGAWSQDGTILFAPVGGLRRVSAAGGDSTLALGMDKSRKEVGQLWPHFLPDGRHYLYSSLVRDLAKTAIYVASLDSTDTRRLMSSQSNVAYAAPGFLIYAQGDVLMAQAFDARDLRLKGNPFPTTESADGMVHQWSVTERPYVFDWAFSVSKTGVLAYRAPGPDDTQLAWYNRSGKRLASIGAPGNYGQIALSPDEKRLAVERSATGNIWMLELSSGIFSRLTFTEWDVDPVWSPDGREVLFTSHRGARWGLYRKVVGGSDETLVVDSAEDLYSENWFPDGRSIVIIDQGGKAFSQVPLSGDRKPVVLMKSEFGKDEPHVSPDGRWIAYNTDESGRWEVYVAAFPGFNGKRQVSNNGGAQALWRKDGKELFYLSLDGTLMAVDVKSGATIETGLPKALFRTPLVVVLPREDQYCVTGDGLRFLFGEPVGGAVKPINIVLNWTTDLKR